VTGEHTIPISATCPDCGGALLFRPDALEFSCVIGHGYSCDEFLQAHFETQKRALIAALTALAEATQVLELLTPFCSMNFATAADERAKSDARQAADIRHLLERLEPYPPAH